MGERRLNVQRLEGERVRFEYHMMGQYVRRIVTLKALTMFLTGEVELNHNLAPGASSMELGKFMSQEYLPRCARPRFTNHLSYEAEVDLVKTLDKTLGALALHEITSREAEKHKTSRLEQGISNNTIKKELHCLRRIMDYAVRLGLVRENLLPPVKGLPSRNRRDIWLRKEEIERLLPCCSERIREYVEVLILTGARVGEALDLKEGDLDLTLGILRMPTEKQRRPPREIMREFRLESLGPRLTRLLESLVPHPKTGYYFCQSDDGRPLRYDWVNREFVIARGKAGLDHVHLHDLRGTFTMHRSMVVKNFRQLQAELGHRDAHSIQSYLDRAQCFNPEESIFYSPNAETRGSASRPEIDAVPRVRGGILLK